jgi:aminodeoxyfutalosine deaminase
MSAQTHLENFIAGLPKAELHVHHVGSASPRIVAELAARHPDSVVPTDPAALAAYFDFTDFVHFIQLYLSVVDLVRTPDDVRMLTYEIARDMARQQIRYAELTVTPYTSMVRGIAPEAFCEAIEDARTQADKELGVLLRWTIRHPRRGRPAGGGRDAADRHRAAAGRAGVVRPRRAGDRGRPAAVPAVLRRRPGGRPAQRAARR